MRTIIFIFILGWMIPVSAQQGITLQDCYRKAIENHPLGLNESSLEEISQLNEKIISSSWLPGAAINAQVSWQSDVTQVNVELPSVDIPSPSHDQYRLSLEVQQLIYDGGISKRRQQLRQAAHQADLQELQVQIYPVLSQINQHFFQQFLLQENIKVHELSLEEIDQRLQVIQSAIRNGTLSGSAQWSLQAEQLRVQQALEELETAASSNLEVLSILVGEELRVDDLQLTEELPVMENNINRPEIRLFELQKEKLLSSARVTATGTMPRISGFAQGGYGKPGLNMLSDQFDLYYIAGIRLSWNIWDWKSTSRQRQVQQINAETISHQQQAFEQNIQVALAGINSRILQLRKGLEKDQEIIGLQENILESASSQLQNEVITSADYISHLNDLAKARIGYNSRKIKLRQAIAEYNTITGNQPHKKETYEQD